MAYPSTLPPTAKLPALEAGEQIVTVAQAPGILAGRFAIARQALPAEPAPTGCLPCSRRGIADRGMARPSPSTTPP